MYTFVVDLCTSFTCWHALIPIKALYTIPRYLPEYSMYVVHTKKQATQPYVTCFQVRLGGEENMFVQLRYYICTSEVQVHVVLSKVKGQIKFEPKWTIIIQMFLVYLNQISYHLLFLWNIYITIIYLTIRNCPRHTELEPTILRECELRKFLATLCLEPTSIRWCQKRSLTRYQLRHSNSYIFTAAQKERNK